MEAVVVGMNNAENKSIRNSGLLTIGAAGAAVAAVANSALYGIGQAADMSFDVAEGGTERTVTLGAAIGTSLSMVVIGLLGVSVAYRFFGRRSLRPFGALGMIIALLSSASFPGAEADTSTKWLLFSMHVLVGVVYLASLEIVRSRATRETSSGAVTTEDDHIPAVAVA